MQGRGGGRRRRRSHVLTSSAVLRTKLAREALDASRGRTRLRRASHPLATSEAEFEEQQHGALKHHRRRFVRQFPWIVVTLTCQIFFLVRLSVSYFDDNDVTALMTKYGAPLNSDPWTWAQGLWWEDWFPQVLRECRQALARYYHGDQLRALIGSSIPEGGFKDEERSVKKVTKKVEKEDVVELRTTSPCEGDLKSWEEEVGTNIWPPQ